MMGERLPGQGSVHGQGPHTHRGIADKHKQRLLPLSRRNDASHPPPRIAACRDVGTNLVGKDDGLGERVAERLRYEWARHE